MQLRNQEAELALLVLFVHATLAGDDRLRRTCDDCEVTEQTEVANPHEEARLEAVRRYAILDTPSDGTFDRITELAARLFDVPISIISIVDKDRIWFKSHHGIDAEQIDREPGLCASAILHHEPWVVTDAKVDPRTLANPLVAGELGLRFYAGIPLRTQDGFNLGTFNIIDVEPRELTGEEMQTLSDLAAIVVDELELRLAAGWAVTHADNARRNAMRINDSVVQRLTAANMALELADQEKAKAAIDAAIEAAREAVSTMLDDALLGSDVSPGDLVTDNDQPA